MRLRRSIMVFVCGMLLLVGSVGVPMASANPGMHERGGPHGKMGGKHGLVPWAFHGVDLSKAQRAQSRTIVKAHEATVEAIEDDIHEARQAIAAALVNPAGVTAADLQPLSNQLTTLTAQLMQERLAMALEIRAILTPEQLAQAAERWQKK
jgi:Spy/CpxP family protein refolding chaperone